MQFHRPSTFGAGVISLPATPQAVPYAGWVAPPSDRTNATRQLQWLEDRIHEIHQQAGRLRQKHSQLLVASADRFVLDPLEASLKEMETELRTLENDRRHVARKVANMEKREKERADKEALAAQAKAYHKLTMKRQSVFGPPSTQAAQKAIASSSGVQRRTSMFHSPTQDTTPAGMEPGGSHAEFMAMAASLSKANGTNNPHANANPNVDHSDLNWDSSMDQELFLERVAQRVHRDSIFEQQFGHLSEGKTSSSGPGGRKQSVSRRPSALNMPRRSSTIQTSTQQPPMGARHRSTQSRSISFPHHGGGSHRGPVLIAEESDEENEEEEEEDSDITTDSEASDASDIYTPNSASSHGSASSGHHPHHHRAHSSLNRQSSSNSSNQGSASSLASLAENSNSNSNANASSSSSSTAATSASSAPFTSSSTLRKPSSTSRKRMSSEGKSSSYSTSAAAKKSTSAYSSIDTAPHARPTFLAQAADISSSDLSTSLQNYLTHSNAPKGITATEALIDPHLREKISKALQAYISAATQAALEGHDIVDHDDASSTASSSHAPSPAVPQPSREETLLWGLLMGALRTAEEEQLAIEWWADREKQLFLEVEQRRKRNEAALAARQLSESQRHSGVGPIIGLGGSGGGGGGGAGNFNRLSTMTAPPDYSHSYKPANSSPSLSNSTLMERHAQRGALLNSLSVAQEQLRQLKAAKHLNESALRQLNDAQRQKEFQARHGVLAAAFAANQQQLQKKLAQQNKIKNAAVGGAGIGGTQNAAVVGSGVSFQFQPNSGIVTVSNSAHIESMCRRFVLGVVNAALVNASTLARQDRTIKDLKWAIAKARRIADLTKNGSINRPASARPRWISAVSVPTPMPRLSSEGDVTQFLTVEPEGLTRPLSAAVRLASDEREDEEEDEDEKSPMGVQKGGRADGTFESPIREVRAGRGWKDAAYVPHDFDAEAARDAQRKGINFVFPPPMISPPKKVQKTQIDPTPFLPQDVSDRRSVSPSKRGGAAASSTHSGNSINAIDAELNSFPMDVGRMPDATVVQEDETTRAAVEEWKHMRESRETALATLQAAQALSNAHHHHHHHHHHGGSSVSGGGGGGGSMSIRHADPSLLGTPPPLHVSPAVAEDSWGTFVTALENVKNRNKQAALNDKAALDSSRGPAGSNSSGGNGPKIVLTVTGGPSKDPTNKTKPPAPTAAQRYAAAAKGSSNPLVDIPKKCLPRSIYEGCSLANPHPDKQPDACHMIQIRSRTLLAKAKRLGLTDVEKTMKATTKLFSSHFHPGTNSFEWLPIDPLNPARKCVDGCRMHYAIDSMGIMTGMSPTRKKPTDNDAAKEEEKQQPQLLPQPHQPQQPQQPADARPKSARASSLRRSNSPTVKRQGSTGSRTARPSTAHPRATADQGTTETQADISFAHSSNNQHNVHFAAAAAVAESRESAADSASRVFRIEVAKSRPATANPAIGREADNNNKSQYGDMSLPPRSITPHPPAPLASPRTVSFRNVTVVIPKPD